MSKHHTKKFFLEVHPSRKNYEIMSSEKNPSPIHPTGWIIDRKQNVFTSTISSHGDYTLACLCQFQLVLIFLNKMKSDGLIFWSPNVRIIGDQMESLLPGRIEDLPIGCDVGNLKLRQSTLLRSEELPRPPQFQINLSNFKSVICL